MFFMQDLNNNEGIENLYFRIEKNSIEHIMCFTTLIQIAQVPSGEDFSTPPENYYEGDYNNELVHLYPLEKYIMEMLSQRGEEISCMDILELLIPQFDEEAPEDLKEDEVQIFYEVQLAKLFEIKSNTPIADFLEGFQLQLGDGFYVDLRDLILIRAHSNCVYVVSLTLLRPENSDQTQNPENTLNEDIKTYPPFFNKKNFPIGKYISSEGQNKPNGLFFSIYLIQEELIMKEILTCESEAQLLEFDFLDYVSDPSYFAFIPLVLQQGTFLQGKFSIPIYDYYHGVLPKLKENNLWLLSGKKVANQAGVKGELEIRVILREFVGVGDQEDRYYRENKNKLNKSFIHLNRMFVNGEEQREDKYGNLNEDNCPNLLNEIDRKGFKNEESGVSMSQAMTYLKNQCDVLTVMLENNFEDEGESMGENKDEDGNEDKGGSLGENNDENGNEDKGGSLGENEEEQE